jgi:hypothetical protein
MIDFYSSRPGADPQAVACARLLVAVIVQAVQDASADLSVKELAERKNLNTNAAESIHFLFIERGGRFEQFCELLEIDAERLRLALLEKADAYEMPVTRAFGSRERRVLHARYRMSRGAGDAAGSARLPAV